MDYYYEHLNDLEKYVYEDILKAARTMQASVTVKGNINTVSMSRILEALQYDHTALFFVDWWKTVFYPSLFQTKVDIKYTADIAQVKQMRQKQRRRLQDMKRKIRQEGLSSDQDVLRWIHHQLVRKVRYDHAAIEDPQNHPRAFTIQGVFEDRLAVCQGIAFAFKLMCDYFEIPCIVAKGKATLENIGNNLLHAWNIVCLDGKYTHVDITWDIGSSEMCKFYRYDYFCIPDSWIRMDHAFDGYPACTDESLNYFVRKGRVFSNERELKKYIRTEIKNKAEYLYFKYYTEGDPAIEGARTDQLVTSVLAADIFASYRFRRITSGLQYCYYYEISRQSWF